jgi:hypothetical protein
MVPFIENKVNWEYEWQIKRLQRRVKLSYEGFMVDALASRADEGRG